MATAEAVPPFPQGDCYKYQWARYVARNTLENDLRGVKALINQMKDRDSLDSGIIDPSTPITDKTTINDLYKQTKDATGGGVVPPDLANFNVGIVGAGAAGLFTALLFDWLNTHPELKGKLHIDYDILEANDSDRLGGRLFTYEFPQEPPKEGEKKDDHLYYDVGAMRFPDNPIMDRTFRLFKYIGIDIGRYGRIPYYMQDLNKVCPTHYNDINILGKVWPDKPPPPPAVFDPFQLNSGLPDDDKIPDNLTATDPGTIAEEVIQPIVDEVRVLLDKQRKAKEGKDKQDPPIDEKKLWATLMSLDKMSARQFFASTDNKDSKGNPLPTGPGYNFNTIEWIETATSGTGWYDQALTEMVLEELDFAEGSGYWCIDGGAQKIAKMMRDKIMVGKAKSPIQYNTQVTGIDANIKKRLPGSTYEPLSVKFTKTDPVTKEKTEDSQKYFAVFNSTTLGALQRMDLRDAGLLWGTKQAIRSLSYSASTKVAIKFRTPWWQLKPYFINKGGLAHSDLPLRTCVYPSYNIESEYNPDWNKDKPSVLLCSYSWAQDALRLGALVNDKSPKDEEELKRLLLHELAVLHARDEPGYRYEDLHKKLHHEYITHHAWDWYKDPHAAGAFAFFGPGQFSNMWPEITRPNSFGQLYLVGEAASAHHAWVVGALESVVRAVYTLFQGLKGALKKDFPPYDTVLRLLSKDSEEGLPFYPLPAEMPERQLETERGAPTKDLQDAEKPKGDLSYAAAVAALSQVESLFEAQYEDKL